MKSNKVLFISHVDSLGGAETVLTEVIDSMNDKNSLIIVTNKRGNRNFSRKYLEDLSVKRMNFGLVGRNVFRTFMEAPLTLIALLKLIIIIEKNNIDLIYSNTSVNIVGCLASIITNRKHIWHIHEQFNGFINDKFKFIYHYLMNYKNNINVFISKEISNEWKNKIEDIDGIIIGNPVKKSVLKNKINECSLKLKKNEIVFGFAGSIVENKNLILILKSLEILKQNNIKYKFVVVGDGDLKNEMIKYTEQNKINEYVKFLGNIDDMSKFYLMIDVLILPSFTEGVPLVVLEAIINKKLIILTKNSGVGDILVKNEDYIAIDPHNSDELANKIRDIIENKYKYYSFVENSYEKVDKYLKKNNFDKSIKKIVNSMVTRDEY